MASNWLYLANELGSAMEGLPNDFRQHIMWAISTRAKQQDLVLCHLALFLDPRYRKAAKLSTADRSIAEFTKAAGKLAHNQGFSEDKLTSTLQQLQLYSLAKSPFDLPAIAYLQCRAESDVKVWWLSMAESAPDLSELALILLDVAPHAADPELGVQRYGLV